MEQVNAFHKGIVSDLDFSKVSNEQWVFPTQNIRILNKEGQGYIVSLIKSNKVEFTLKSGYVIIGAKEHEGIVFILSTNGINGEIGCYPSPKSYTATTTTITETGQIGFERTYKPLPNFTQAINPNVLPRVRKPFNTNLFIFGKDYKCDIVVRKEYDDSYNIYFTDFNNPIRFINSGFNHEGYLNERILWNNSFPNQISLLPGTDSSLKVSQFTNGSGIMVEPTGELKSGNYIFYIGYMDFNFTPTPYVLETSAIQVYDGNESLGEFNVQGKTGALGQDVTNKKIRIFLSDIDTNYKYLNIAYIRYFSDDNQPILSEYYKIVEPKEITGTDMYIDIINHEDTGDITIGEILEPFNAERTCKSIEHINNYMFGANWKTTVYHNDEFIEFAKRIEAHADTIKELDINTLGTPKYAFGDYQYKFYLNTYDNAGYFRSESYAFSVVFEMNDGTITNGYPVKGIDALLKTAGQITEGYNTDTDTNEYGILRFPKNHYAPIIKINGLDKHTARIMGVRFRLDKALKYIDNLSTSFIKSNVRAIRFARTDRFDNLVYQGFTFNMSIAKQLNIENETYPAKYLNGYDISAIINSLTYLRRAYNEDNIINSDKYGLISSTLINADRTKYSDKYLPLYLGHLPCMFAESNSDYKEHSLFMKQMIVDIRKAALYSIDNLFDNGSNDTRINYLEEQGQLGFRRVTGERGVLRVYPEYVLHDTDQFIQSEEYISKVLSQDDYKFIDENIFPTSTSEYISAATDIYSGQERSSAVLVQEDNTYKLNNRDIRTKNYIALSTGLETFDYDNTYKYHNKLMNLYKNKPEDIDIKSLYSQLNTYKFISGSIELDTMLEDYDKRQTYSKTFYRGDCFLQKTYFKQSGWNNSAWISGYYDTTKNRIDGEQVFNQIGSSKNLQYHTHGVVFGIVSENKYNTAMRHNDTVSNYIPLLNEDAALHVLTPTSKPNGNEKYLLNSGYNKILGENVISLYNPQIPYIPFKRPTRIRYTEIHQPYSYIDGYRLWNINSYHDYDLKEGSINKIGEMSGMLISVQDKCINEHNWGDGKLELQDNQFDIALGTSELLSPYARKIADFGSQHITGVLFTGGLVYGIDFNQGIIWMLNAETSQFNKRMIVGANDLSKKLFIESEILKFKNIYDSLTDKVSALPDDIYNGNGIVIGYNKEYGEIYFTIKFKKNDIQYEKTFVYNENLGIFTGENTFNANVYISLIKQMLSFKGNNNQNIYLHDAGNDYLNFYGTTEKATISFIVSGIGEQNATIFTKQFYSLEIESPEKEFSNILYSTQYQNGLLNPFMSLTNFWENPEYEENRWKIPLSVASDGENDFEIDSQLTGKWLKVTLEYQNSDEFYIKNVITKFNISKT